MHLSLGFNHLTKFLSLILPNIGIMHIVDVSSKAEPTSAPPTRRYALLAVSAVVRLVTPLLPGGAATIEREVHALLARLFADRRSYPVVLVLDVWPPRRLEVPALLDNSIVGAHRHTVCENGHTLTTENNITTYTCFAYVTRVEMRASCTIVNKRVASIQTNALGDGIRTSTAASPTFMKDLARLRNLLREAVDRLVVEARARQTAAKAVLKRVG